GAAVRAQVFHPDGWKAGEEFLVNTTTANNQTAPAITALADGRFVASWTDFSQTDGNADASAIHGQVFNANGETSGSEFLINTATGASHDHATITGLLDGRFVVAWVDEVQVDPDTLRDTIRAQVFDPNGDKFGGELALSPESDTRQFNPVVTPLA